MTISASNTCAIHGTVTKTREHLGLAKRGPIVRNSLLRRAEMEEMVTATGILTEGQSMQESAWTRGDCLE